MVLLHLLHQLSKKNRWRITVAHLNHKLRGRSSDADERMVARAARKLGLPLVIESADVRKLAKTGKLSLEMAARKTRHEFLADAAARLKIPTVALAHHADDQVELFFLRLLRGSGSDGLAGMKWRGPSPANPKIELIRPFLEQSKVSLRGYAASEKITFREDASNEWLDIQRNLIRHELAPLLRRKYQPALNRIILRLMDILAAESEVMTDIAREWLTDKTREHEDFTKLPTALQRRCIQLQLLQSGVPADFGLVERLRTSPGQPFTIVPQVVVMCDANGKLSLRNSASVVSKPTRVELHLNGGAGEIDFSERTIRWRVDRQKAFRLPLARPRKEIFDADKVGPRIVLRHWRPGDRFQPIGMKKTVKLQDFFTNQKIPRAKRHDLIVAVTAQNEVFWVESLRISERFKLTTSTQRCLTWGWK